LLTNEQAVIVAWIGFVLFAFVMVRMEDVLDEVFRTASWAFGWIVHVLCWFISTGTMPAN
jgi:hypothetical protein